MYHDDQIILKGVAHDINGLMARAGLAAEELHGHSDCRVKAQAERISLAIECVAEICRTRLASGLRCQRKEVLGPACIERQLTEITRLVELEALAARREIRFTDNIANDVSVECNPVSLFRILFNLSVNAVSAIAKGGGSSLDVSVYRRDADVFFDIRDDGPGLPDCVLSYLLLRADGRPATGARLGSGLITSCAMAREMGGELRLLETSPSGTSFRLAVRADFIAPVETGRSGERESVLEPSQSIRQPDHAQV